MLPTEETQWLVYLLLKCYAEDPTFQDELTGFFEGHREVLEEATGYVFFDDEMPWDKPPPFTPDYFHDLKAFATKWGLDLIGCNDVDGINRHCGFNALYRWCGHAHELGNAKPAHFGDQDYPFDELSRDEPDIDDMANVIQVRVRGEWRADKESRDDAKTRLLKACECMIDAQLAAIAPIYTGVGYRVRDTQDREQQHVSWLFQRVAYRRSSTAISKTADRNAKTIRNTTNPLAKRLGIPLPPKSDPIHAIASTGTLLP